MQKESNTKSSYKKNSTLSSQNNIATNPIDKSGLVAKINILGSGMNSVKTPHGYSNYHSEKSYGVIDYASFIKETNEIVRNHKDLRDSLNAFHNMFVNRLNCTYTAIGLINEQSNYVNVKLLDKNSTVYSFKVFMNDKENEIIKSLDTGEISIISNSAFLKVPSLVNVPSVIIPIQVQGRNICIALASDHNIQNHISLYQLAATNLGLLVQNSSLYEKVSQNSYIDSLTNLYNHRRFHELLLQEMKYAG